MRKWIVLPLLLASLAGCLGGEEEAPSQEAAAPAGDTPLHVQELLPASSAAANDAVLPLWDALANATDGAAATVTVTGDPAFLLAADPRNGMTDFELELVPSSLLTNETWLEVDGVRYDMPDIRVYEGHVVGDETAAARLTVTPEWARGTVRLDDVSYRIRVNMDGNFPIGMELRDGYEGGDEAGYHPALAAPAPFTFDKDGQMPHDCLSPVPDTASPQMNVLGASGNDVLTARIILDADALYAQTLGHDTFPMMVAMLAEVDAIYDHQMALRYQIMGLHVHTTPDAMSAPADAAPLGDLSEYWNARSDLRDMVHLYTGHPSSYAQANCIGGAGMPDLAYTFTTIHWASESSGKMRHEQTYAHELGHILNAHHHYGNPLEGGLSTTVMHQGGEKVHPVFSWASKSVIRGWAETHLGQHDPAPESA
ncbi:MAG: M12 family metallo-peptidase [Thermoplasmatota archaeon]